MEVEDLFYDLFVLNFFFVAFSFMLRFWVTILKNPESVFDVEKPDTIASSMDVISQTFIDACSVQEHKPTKVSA